MNEWFKKTLEKIKTLWAKWSVVQKIILVGIIVGVIVGFVLLFSVSSAPTTVSVYGVAIGNATELDNISTFLSETGIKHSISDGKIFVDDEKTANKARTEISVAGLSPRNFDPWDYLGSDSWAGSDFKNDQNVQKRVMDMLTEHIRSLDDISDANVILTFPKEALFSSEQEPVKASVAIRVKKGSDILENKKRLKGLQSLIVQAVDGLKEENITITDMATGEILNDFSSMKNFDDVDLAEREFKLLSDEEEKYKQKIATALYQTFGKKRVTDINVKFEIDYSSREIKEEEFYPVTIKVDDPTTPYDDSEYAMSITRSTQTSTTRWQGTGYNPEGPAGVEGQTSPVYKDSSNLYGLTEQSMVTKNEEVNKRDVVARRRPQHGRRTVTVNIDGTYRLELDENGNYVMEKDGVRRKREYIPLSSEELAGAKSLIMDAIGYDVKRGDSVSVHNIKFYRDDEFEAEDAAWLKSVQTQNAILYSLIGVTVLLVLFIAVKLIMREMERRRRLREEEKLRAQQLEREQRLWNAEQAGMDVSMSVEERKRLELQENAINMAKEHPEDVALLIRTWLMEE